MKPMIIINVPEGDCCGTCPIDELTDLNTCPLHDDGRAHDVRGIHKSDRCKESILIAQEFIEDISKMKITTNCYGSHDVEQYFKDEFCCDSFNAFVKAKEDSKLYFKKDKSSKKWFACYKFEDGMQGFELTFCPFCGDTLWKHGDKK